MRVAQRVLRSCIEPTTSTAIRRANLRTHLGTAPGVGKTYAMLSEGAQRAGAGDRVIVGSIETHDRVATATQMRSLETAPPRTVEYRGQQFEEMDVDAIVRARPDLVLVDELAHTWPDGKRHRWQDVCDLLEAGVDVTTTVNIANLDSARNFAARVTGAGLVSPVPDALVREGEVVLVDLPPDALRRRIAAGDVYTTDRVGGALSRYFSTSNLEFLSRLARAWMDGNLETTGEDLVRIAGAAPPPRSVLAAVSGSSWTEPVIRRAEALARDNQAELIVVHVNVADGLQHRPSEQLVAARALACDVGAAYADVQGGSVPHALAAAAYERNASRIVVARHRSRLSEILRGSVAARLRRLVPDLEVDEVRAAN
jgi:two-component system sensor histidine kinase KdpD